MPEAVTVQVSGEVLGWARRQSSTAVEIAAQRVGVPIESITSWEANGSRPALSALRELSLLYGVPLSVFLLDQPPELPARPVDLRSAAANRNVDANAVLAKALNRAIALQGTAQWLMQAAGDQAIRPVTTADEGDFETLALQRRLATGITIEDQRQWRDERAALRAWRAAIENIGIFVLQLPMPRDSVKAFSLSDLPPFVVLNQSDFVRSRIFSLLHEYAHVLLGTGAICIPGAGRQAMEQGAAVEVFCNRFAGAFLVPGDSLRADPLAREVAASQGIPEDADLERVARRFHVSWAVIWYRMRELGMITQARFTRKWDDWDQFPMPHAGGGGMTHGERVVATYGTRLANLILTAADRGTLTRADAGQYLTFPVWRFAEVQGDVGNRALA